MLSGLVSSWIWVGVFSLLVGAVAVWYKMSPRFRYHFKFALYSFSVSSIAVLLIPFSLLRPRDVRNALMYVPFMRCVSALLGITWELQGEEHLENDSTCIIVCNHQSVLDFLGVMALWPTMKNCAAVGKKELLYTFPLAYLSLRLCGTIIIDRSKPKECQAILAKSTEALKIKKVKVWMFPEGTRAKNPDRTFNFKKGAFHIALENKLPIIPVVFSPYSFINDDKKIFNAGKMVVKVLPPIDTNKFGREDVNKLTELTQSMMTAEFQQLYQLHQIAQCNHGGSEKSDNFQADTERDAFNTRN